MADELRAKSDLQALMTDALSIRNCSVDLVKTASSAKTRDRIIKEPDDSLATDFNDVMLSSLTDDKTTTIPFITLKCKGLT